MKLTSMTDFVLDQKKVFYSRNTDKLEILENYAEFLKKPLKLSMFVPCDEKEFYLKEPDSSNWENFTTKGDYRDLNYIEAINRVLFINSEFDNYGKLYCCNNLIGRSVNLKFYFEGQFKTIEDLLKEYSTLEIKDSVLNAND